MFLLINHLLYSNTVVFIQKYLINSFKIRVKEQSFEIYNKNPNVNKHFKSSER